MERWLKTRQDRVWSEDLAAKLEGDLTAQSHQDVLKRVVSLIVGNSVLDVGCGFGELIPYLSHVEYVGVDSSEAMLKRARTKFPKAFFLDANLYTLDFHKCDTVVAIDFLHHQPALEPAFSKLLALAEKRLIVTLWIWGRTKGQDGPRQYHGMWGEFLTWHTEKELRQKFKGLTYRVEKSIGGLWSDLYIFDV
ncbi:hypothetical protein ES703_02125 [subsurface metagenome]